MVEHKLYKNEKWQIIYNGYIYYQKKKPAMVVIVYNKFDLQPPVQQCISPLKLWIRIPFMARCTRYNTVSDLRQVGGFIRVLWFPPPIKLTATI